MSDLVEMITGLPPKRFFAFRWGIATSRSLRWSKVLNGMSCGPETQDASRLLGKN
jgi:hypothetical protein